MGTSPDREMAKVIGLFWRLTLDFLVRYMFVFLTSDLQTRKPYTITKQREKWTDEEHNRFLEALRLHGRAWQRIQGNDNHELCF